MTSLWESEDLTVIESPHGKDRFDDLIATCRTHLTPSGLHFAAHYHLGIMDFSVDALDTPDLAADLPESRSPAVLRDELSRLGQRLDGTVHRLDHALRNVDSGRLVRTVFDVGRGGVYHYPIRRDQYLVGVTLRETAVRNADVMMAELVTDIRSSRRITPQNPGGFASSDKVEFDRDLAGRSVDPVIWGPASAAGPAVQPAVQHCLDALDPEHTHYVALYHDGVAQFAVDCLGHPALHRFFAGQVTPSDRRTSYRYIANLVNIVTAQFNQREARMLGGSLRRTVLDVEEGALSYFLIQREPEVIVLVGITLDQSKVDIADNQLCRLAARLTLLIDQDT